MSTYWFMRMKQGAKGEDFSKELWEQCLVGVLFGTWKLELVQREDGSIDKDRIDADYIQRQCEQPKGIRFTDRFLTGARTFLCDVPEGDKIVVYYDHALHIGTVGAGYSEDPEENPSRGKYGERFKCRPIEEPRAFPVAELPASYRLIKSTGRSAIQEIRAYRRLVEVLDECKSSAEVEERFSDMCNAELLEVISDKQWEVLCAEYLRKQRDFRPLLLAIGLTLPEIDLYGVDRLGQRILAQCKNNSSRIDSKNVEKWEKELDKRDTDELFFFARGGIAKKDHAAEQLGCEIRTGKDILEWLEEDPEYARSLRTL